MGGAVHAHTHNVYTLYYVINCHSTCSYVFKLADFGTARQLGPDEHFTSLHGTEEYLVKEHSFINELSLSLSLSIQLCMGGPSLIIAQRKSFKTELTSGV